MTTLIKFQGDEMIWQCVDNMENKLFKEWILDNADQILNYNEVEEQYLDNLKYFKSCIGGKSRINEEYLSPDELMEIFNNHNYDEIKEHTIHYDRFIWLHWTDIKNCFESDDLKIILDGTNIDKWGI